MKKLIALIMTLILCVFAFASCAEPTPDENLIAAGDILFDLYKDAATVTPNDYDIVGQVMIGELVLKIEWTVDVDSVTIKESTKTGFFTVDVDEKSATDVAYKLTGTIKAENGATISKTFDRTVPAYKVMSYAEYAAAEDDSSVLVSGIVTGIFSASNGSSANGLYIQDANGEGGYYVYGVADKKDPVADLGIKVGMTVTATGLKDTYNGLYEIIDAVITIDDETVKEVAPIDYTEIFKSAADLKAEALVGKQSVLVTVKGVEITGQDEGSGYFKFKLGELETYVRISSSNNCITKDEITAFKALHTEKFGFVADVTGIVQLYNGAFYLIPANADVFTNIALPNRTDAEKAQFELDAIKLDAKITSDKVIDLVLAGVTYSDVKIAWVSDNAAIAIADGKATVKVPDSDTKVKLTATATIGSETKTRDFEITLSKSLTSIKEALEIGAAQADYTAEKYLIAGVITELQSDKYGNIVITDETGKSILIYGLYTADGATRYDKMETKPVVGDYIVALGVLGQYKGTAQMKNGWLVSHVTPTTVDKALEIGAAQTDYTAEKYLVSGEITELQSDKYGNIVIKAGEKTILIYGTYSSDNGATRYDKMETKPVVGDTITVLGVLGQYKGTAQMKNGWLVAHTVKAAGGDTTTGGSDVTTNTPAGTTTGSTPSTPATPSGSYTKVTTVAVGDKLVMTNIAGTYEFGGISGTKGLAVAYTGNFAASNIIEVVAGVNAGTVAFKVGDKYLAWTSGNSLTTVDTVDASSSWTVTAGENDTVVITHVGTTERVLQFNANANQERFCAYKGTQQAVVLYKQNAAA